MTSRSPGQVAIVGGGHNALVASIYLARAGFEVDLIERLPHVGGAAISAEVFEGHAARLSRFSYLVSLMPEELIADLGMQIELRSRDTASYTPYVGPNGPAGLLIETNEGPATQASFEQLTGGRAEFAAWQRFYAEVATVARAVSPTLLSPLPTAAAIGEQVDPVIWSELAETPLGVGIERRFGDDTVRGVVATDALIGTFASLHDESLIQNRCFLYHLIGNGTGEWRVPVGGMGAVTGELERLAREAGVRIRTNCTVTDVHAHDDRIELIGDDLELTADWMLCGVAPYVLELLRGRSPQTKPSGSQLKVNLLVSRLPQLASGDDPEVAFAGTFHIGEKFSELEAAYRQAAGGDLPSSAAGELYCHTLTDRSILGPELAATSAQTLTYFGLHTPYEVLDHETTQAAFGQFLAALNEHLAEPIEPLILGIEFKSPADVEAALGMPGGHIFHGDLQWPWLAEHETAVLPAERWGVATDHPRILMCGSGARRGGAVSGIGGHNAAQALLDHVASLMTL